MDAIKTLEEQGLITTQGAHYNTSNVSFHAASMNQMSNVRPSGPPDPRSRATGRFRHTVMQDVAYKILSEQDRANYHRRAALAMEEHYLEFLIQDSTNTADLAAKLAYHFELCGHYLRSIFYWNLAADLAGTLHGNNNQLANFLRKILVLVMGDKAVEENLKSEVPKKAGQENALVKNKLAKSNRANTKKRSAEITEGVDVYSLTVAKWERRLADVYLISGQGPAVSSCADGYQLIFFFSHCCHKY